MQKKAKFNLDKPTDNKETYIFLKYSCQDGVLKYLTQERINPENWDFATQRAISDKKVNGTLKRLSAIVEQYQETCRIYQKPVKKEELRAELNGATGKVEAKRENNFFTHIDILISMAEIGKLLTKEKKIYTPGTIKNWKKSKSRLEQFQPDMTFEGITLKTYTDFIIWCNTKKYAANYIGLLIKDWKNFMSLAAASPRNWHQNAIHHDPGFKKVTERVFKVYLNEEEIQAMYSLPLTGMQERIRDGYIVNTYNGLRISDMKTLTIDNIENDTITHINRKTNKKVSIPVHHIVEEIIRKYNGKIPKIYSEGVINREIKIIAKLAGIINKIRFTKTVGGREKEFIIPKWKLITNHTARRSMATNILKHADSIEVMPVLGMSLKTLELYNKITPEENAHNLKENSFFKKRSPER